MREIEILNSNLKLVQVPISSSGNIRIPFKSSLRYQEVVLIERRLEETTFIETKSLKGISEINILTDEDERLSSNGISAWTINKDSEIFKERSELEQDEIIVLLAFIYSNCTERIDLTDLLVNTLGDSKVYSEWISAFGRSELLGFQRFIVSIILDIDNFTIKPCNIQNIHAVDLKYSIQDLLDDLVSDKAEILVDKELIGEYQKISPSQRKIPSEIEILEQEWSPIIDVVGNRTRANLSLRYGLKVNVPIPTNPYVSEKQITCFCNSNMCIIKDGKLWVERLGVRVSSKLAGKLKRLGIVKMELFKNNDFLIDFANLPICRKEKVSSYELARLELRVMISKIALEYLEHTKTIKKGEVAENPKEKFLRTLGIIGDQYYPSKENYSKSSIYQVTEYVALFDDIPSTLKKRTSHYEAFKYGHCKIKTMRNILSLVKERTQEEWGKEYKESVQKLRRTKFSLIMGKLVRFSDTKSPIYWGSTTLYLGKPDKDRAIRIAWNLVRKNISYDKQ